MCPVCIANLTLIAAGASLTSGLAAFAIKKLFGRPSKGIEQTESEESKGKTRKQSKRRQKGSKSSLLKFTINTVEGEK
jgi:hypothetical protein